MGSINWCQIQRQRGGRKGNMRVNFHVVIEGPWMCPRVSPHNVLSMGLVLVEGAQKEWNTRLEAVMPDFCGVLHGVWMEGLKAESMQTLARWHWHQAEIVATAYTAASKVFF